VGDQSDRVYRGWAAGVFGFWSWNREGLVDADDVFAGAGGFGGVCGDDRVGRIFRAREVWFFRMVGVRGGVRLVCGGDDDVDVLGVARLLMLD
jgi:hypothetical protein